MPHGVLLAEPRGNGVMELLVDGVCWVSEALEKCRARETSCGADVVACCDDVPG